MLPLRSPWLFALYYLIIINVIHVIEQLFRIRHEAARFLSYGIIYHVTYILFILTLQQRLMNELFGNIVLL